MRTTAAVPAAIDQMVTALDERVSDPAGRQAAEPGKRGRGGVNSDAAPLFLCWVSERLDGLWRAIAFAPRAVARARALRMAFLSPTERVGRLMPPAVRDDTLRALRWLADAGTPIIVIGGVAAALQGGPQQPDDGRVEFVSGDPFAMEAQMRAAGLTPIDMDERWGDIDTRAPWALPGGGTIALASNVPGTRDYADLRRSVRTVELDDGTSVPAAHPRDLLRMADASLRESERVRVPGLRALLSHTVDRGAQT